jgi:hypothetical protein
VSHLRGHGSPMRSGKLRSKRSNRFSIKRWTLASKPPSVSGLRKRTPPARQTPELAIVGRAHRESSHSARRSDGGLSGDPKQDTDQLLYGQASGQFKSQTPSSTTSTICPTALHHRRRLRRCRAQTQSAENARKSVMMMALGNKTQSPPRKLVIGQACLKVE